MPRSGGLYALVLAMVFALTEPVHAEAVRSIEEFLVTDGELPFLDVKNRIAAFTFEDPDHTGLGDSMAFLTTKRVLFDANVGSLAIILFEQALEPDASGLGYFEKVDRLTQGRNFVAAMWGHISRDGNHLVVDTFVQLYPERFNTEFFVNGIEGALRVSPAPSRIWVQSMRFPADHGDTMHTIADSVRMLRVDPESTAEPVEGGILGVGATYQVVERSGSWRGLVLMENQTFGWTSVDASCGVDRHCAGVIAGASYLNDLLRYANGRAEIVPTTEAHTSAARAVAAQLGMIRRLMDGRDDAVILDQVLGTASEWTSRANATGRASFANILAVARLYTLERDGKLNQLSVRSVANELARASLEDPGNVDLLANLVVIFRYLGDEEKLALANSLLEKQLSRSGR